MNDGVFNSHIEIDNEESEYYEDEEEEHIVLFDKNENLKCEFLIGDDFSFKIRNGFYSHEYILMINNTNFKDNGLHIQKFIHLHKYIKTLNENKLFNNQEIYFISVDKDCTYYSL